MREFVYLLLSVLYFSLSTDQSFLWFSTSSYIVAIVFCNLFLSSLHGFLHFAVRAQYT